MQRVGVGDVRHDDHALCASTEELVDRLSSGILAGQVPELDADLGVVDANDFELEIASNCRHVVFLELIIYESVQ